MNDINLYCNKDVWLKINEWFLFLKNHKKYSSNTYQSYFSDIKLLIKFLYLYESKKVTYLDIKNLKIEDIRAFLGERVNNNIKSASRCRELSSIKSFFSFLEKNYQIKYSFLNELVSPKLDKRLPKALGQDDIKKIIESMKSDIEDWVGQRDYLIILIIYASGIRISEAIGLTKDNIYKDYILIKGKGDKERMVPIFEKIYKMIIDYIKLQPFNINNNDKIFKGVRGGDLSPRIIQRKLSNIRKELMLPDYTVPHALRHSFASHMLSGGANLREIQEILGHENLATTEKYTHISTEELVQKYNKFHKR